MPAEGLTAAQAKELLREFGRNQLAGPRQRSRWRSLASQFRNPLIVVLVIAGLVTASIGDYLDSGVILAVVVINALIGWVQEGRAQQALESVRAMLVTTATVVRDGHREVINAAEVVPGDVVVLSAGDRVPADLRLHASHALRIEESSLTGESVPVEKDVSADAMAFAGTMVVSGSGSGEVLETGDRTRMGRIGRLMDQEGSLQTPLTRRLDRFSWLISAVIVGVGAAAWAFAVWLRDYPPMEAFLAVIGLAVAAIPEGLPAIISIVLAIGTLAMARQRVIVRRLPAVETLGSVDVICTDKTGTLTRNEMTAVRLLLPGGDVQVTGVGYAPQGEIVADGQPLSDALQDRVSDLAMVGILCNDAHLTEREGAWAIVGDPTEGALLPLAYKANLDVERVAEEWEALDEIPFDPRARYMATLRRHRDGHVRVFCKGAPEVILGMAEAAGGDSDVDPDADSDADWRYRIQEAAQEGQRVLALACADRPRTEHRIEVDDLSRDLRLVGMVALIDPPRPEVLPAIEACQRAGVRVVMITGDHDVTAAAIARSLGLDGGQPITGEAIEEASDDALVELLDRSDVIARASPEAKMRVIDALQHRDLSVAMTGDGVNDAPALQRADIGVAMGERGTEAARDSSDIILTDDNFATIVAAVRQGRLVYDNILKSLQFILPTNAGEAGLILVALALGITLPVTVGQILWVNLVTTVTLALAFAFEPADPEAMERPPRVQARGILDRSVVARILFVSALIIGTSLLAFEAGLRWFDSIDTARTMAVSMIVLAEMVYVFNIRRVRGSSLSWSVLTENRVALGAVGALIILQAGFVYLPFLQAAFSTAPLSFEAWAFLLGLAAAFFLIVEIVKAMTRRRERV